MELSLKQSIESESNSNLQQEKIPVIFKFDDIPEQKIRAQIRDLGLKRNQLRQECYGYTTDITSFKILLAKLKHPLQIIA